MQFRVSSNDLFRRTAIIVEVKASKKTLGTEIPADFWNFIPCDAQQEENYVNRRVLSPVQVALPTFTCFCSLYNFPSDTIKSHCIKIKI